MIFSTNWLYGVLAATCPRIHTRKAAAPSGPRNFPLTCKRSAHLFVQCSMKSSLPISRSMTASRLTRVSRAIGEERADLSGCRRQPGQIEIDAAEKLGVAAKSGRPDFHALPLAGDQFVDAAPRFRRLPDESAAVAHYRERRRRVGTFVTGEHWGLAAADGGQHALSVAGRHFRVAAVDERLAGHVAVVASE